jgi:hypothetical protein
VVISCALTGLEKYYVLTTDYRTIRELTMALQRFPEKVEDDEKAPRKPRKRPAQIGYHFQG